MKECTNCGNRFFKTHVVTESSGNSIKLKTVFICSKCGTVQDDQDELGDWPIC